MLNQHPIFLIILTSFILIFTVLLSFIKEKFYKKTFFAVTLYLVITIFLAFFYKNIDDKFMVYYQIFVGLTYFIFLLVFTLLFLDLTNENHRIGLMSKALKEINVNAYFIVNKKEKIKDISDSLLTELGKTKKEVLNKNIYDVFDKSIRLMSFNDQDISLNDLRNFYKKYKKLAKKNDKDSREYVFKNYNGDRVAIHFVEQPLFQFNKYKGRVNVGEKKSDVALLNVERDLSEKNKELDLLSNKFIGLIELSEEGIFSKDPNSDYIWISDSLKNILKLNNNTFELKEFYQKIYSEDLAVFLSKANKETYNLRYRFLVNNSYIWLIEKGKRVLDNTYIGIIKEANYKHFERSNIVELDTIGTDIELLNDMEKLYKNNQLFELVLVDIKNIQKINENHGRACGNMMLAEYVKKLRYNFMSENSNVYRVSGLVFAFTITDTRKMELFKRLVTTDLKSMDLSFEFGSVNETITVKMGVALSMNDGYNAEELYQNALTSLKIANNPNYQALACFYKEIKE